MNFQEYIQQDKLVLVDFYADWCGPCQTMEPVIKSLKEKMGEALGIIKIDVDRNQKTAAFYQIRSIPTYLLFRKGDLLWRQSGIMTVHDLEHKVQQFQKQ